MLSKQNDTNRSLVGEMRVGEMNLNPSKILASSKWKTPMVVCYDGSATEKKWNSSSYLKLSVYACLVGVRVDLHQGLQLGAELRSWDGCISTHDGL